MSKTEKEGKVASHRRRWKTRFWGNLPIVVLLVVAGLATGSPVFLCAALMLLLLIVFGFVSVIWAANTMTAQVSLSGKMIHRGADVHIQLELKHHCPLPIAPVEVSLSAAPDAEPAVLQLQDISGHGQKMTMPYHAAHVGVQHPGVETIIVSDLFGLFSLSFHPGETKGELLVLPMTFDVSPLTFSPGDAGLGTMSRASEDLANPSDVRGYQPGDPMKKIHWKLSQRKNELMVRKFEEPIMSEGLILLDCAELEAEAQVKVDLRDTLLETAASVLLSPAEQEHRLHLPLPGKHPIELENGMASTLALENIARVDFSEPNRFERVLVLETRRLRQVGAVVVITAQLTGQTVETMTAMRRMGPKVRLYFATSQPDDPEILPFINRLQQSDCEVCYVTPEIA